MASIAWALQVLGGIEFTWEHELHLVLTDTLGRLSRPTSKRGSPFLDGGTEDSGDPHARRQPDQRRTLAIRRVDRHPWR